MEEAWRRDRNAATAPPSHLMYRMFRATSRLHISIFSTILGLGLLKYHRLARITRMITMVDNKPALDNLRKKCSAQPAD